MVLTLQLMACDKIKALSSWWFDWTLLSYPRTPGGRRFLRKIVMKQKSVKQGMNFWVNQLNQLSWYFSPAPKKKWKETRLVILVTSHSKHCHVFISFTWGFPTIRCMPSGFQSLVSLLNDRPHQGLALFEYTRVTSLAPMTMMMNLHDNFLWQIVDFMCVYSLQSVFLTRPVFFRWIAESWGNPFRSFVKFGTLTTWMIWKCLRWIRCWTSFGLKVQWQHVQRTTFRCIGTAICCPGPWRLDMSKYLWKWVVGIGCYIQLAKTCTDSSFRNGKEASTQDRKKWRVTGLFGNLQLMIQQHLLKTSVYRVQEHVRSSKHLLQLARVL